MNNYEQIHETVIRDVVDVLMDVKNADSLQGVFGNKNSFKSIASATYLRLFSLLPCKS
jgi:hypothetical protein